ncbi:MAG: histidinol-phosphate transaminase [Clostridia bacterium]|nr:histidinol-phosphate transaminase [Clostridia bacterium]
MSRYLSALRRRMIPYVPGEQPQDQRYVKLNTNESPFPPAPGVVEAAAAEAGRLQLYSDPLCRAVRQRLAALHHVDVENVLVTNGSDEALNFLFLAYGDADRPFVFPDLTYGLYPVLCDLYDLPRAVVPLKEDFSVDVQAMARAGGPIVLANPNAPTGMALPVGVIRDLAEQNPDRLVIVDEAYVDFGAESCVPLIHELENLLVVQTFSKSRSLAGGRLGMIFGPAALMREVEAVRCSLNPYNVNRMTLAAGAAALDQEAYTRANCLTIMETRAWTAEQLTRLGFRVLPSQANFLFAAPPGLTGSAYYEKLKEKGVLVRHFKGKREAPFVRVTVGSREQMEILLQKTCEILEETP